DRLSTRGLELVSRIPTRHVVVVRDDQPGQETETGVLDHAVEAPVRRQLVARPVVMLLVVLVDARPAPALGPADELASRAEVECRHADLREIELIRSVVVALIDVRIGLDDASLVLGDLRRDVVQRGLAEPDEGDVFGRPPDVSAVVVQDRGDPAGRDGQMTDEVRGSEQQLLVSSEEDQQYITTWA